VHVLVLQSFEVKGLEGTKQNFALKTTYTMFREP